jgi:hypothetical protein
MFTIGAANQLRDERRRRCRRSAGTWCTPPTVVSTD